MLCTPNRQQTRPRPQSLTPFDATTKDIDDVPSIQSLWSGSFSPAESESSSGASNDTKTSSTKPLSFIRPGYQLTLDDVNNIMMAPELVEQYNAMQEESSTPKSYLEDDECYVSMEYSNLKQLSSPQNEVKLDSRLRKTLINEELNQLIQVCQDNDYLYGHEFEPEAIEALGIAAHQLAYRKKYFDAEKSTHVYVPSVAYTVMNGILLERATAHYFGKSEEFLVAYAGAMGSAILKQKSQFKKYMNQEREEHPLAEEFEIESIDEEKAEEDESDALDSEKVMRLVWGVSPKASFMVRGRGSFSFDERDEAPKPTGWKRPTLSVVLVVAMGLAAAVLLANEKEHAAGIIEQLSTVEMPQAVHASWNSAQTLMSESKQRLSNVGTYWNEQITTLQERMKEETMISETVSVLDEESDHGTGFSSSYLFGDRAVQKAPLSAEEFEGAMNAEDEIDTKKSLSNLGGAEMHSTIVAPSAKARSIQRKSSRSKSPIVANLLY